MPGAVTLGERDRLASLFGALVSSADVASGFHPEKAVRTAIVATRLASAHGLDHAAQGDTFEPRRSNGWDRPRVMRRLTAIVGR